MTRTMHHGYDRRCLRRPAPPEIGDIVMPALPGPTWVIEPIRYGNTRREVEAQSLARQSGPHRVALSEWLAVGRSRPWSSEIAVLANAGGAVAVGWAEDLTDTQFIAIGGMSAPRTELLAAWVGSCPLEWWRA